MGDIVEKRKSKKLTVRDLIFAGAFAAIYAISYVFFNIGTAANFIRIFFAKDAYIANIQKRAGGAFADGMIKLLSPWWSWIAIIGLAVVGGIIGAFIASAIIKKHFEKAGIV